MNIDNKPLISPLLPQRSSSGVQQPQAPARTTQRRVGADGRVTQVELGSDGSTRAVGTDCRNPFSLLGSLPWIQAGAPAARNGDAPPLAQDQRPPAQPGATCARDERSSDIRSQPEEEMRTEVEKDAACAASAQSVPCGEPDATGPEIAGDLSHLRQFVSQVTRRLSVQDSTAEIAFDKIFEGFPSTVVSLRMSGGRLHLDCRCGSDAEAAWFAKHGEALTSRLAGNLRRAVALVINDREAIAATVPGDDDDAAVAR